jgi:hypothetical protein
MMRQRDMWVAIDLVLEHLSPQDLCAFVDVSQVQNYLLLFSWMKNHFWCVFVPVRKYLSAGIFVQFAVI